MLELCSVKLRKLDVCNWRVFANPVTNREQLSIVLRFVDDKMDVREEFMGFVECQTGVTGEALRYIR